MIHERIACVCTLICVVLSLPVACSNQAIRGRQEATDFQSKNVVVSKLAGSEVDQLPTIFRLPEHSCLINNGDAMCSINPNQPIRWGWGFCRHDRETLSTDMPRTQVDLFVEQIRVPDALVYQRDETYNRERFGYCHTWLIKLSDWKRGTTIRLQSKFKTADGASEHSVIMNVWK